MGAGQAKRKAAESAMNQEMDRAGHILQAYRPEATQARMAALQQVAGLYNPLNSALSQMYGHSPMFDLQAATQNPLGQGAMDFGQDMGSSVGWEQPSDTSGGHFSYSRKKRQQERGGDH